MREQSPSLFESEESEFLIEESDEEELSQSQTSNSAGKKPAPKIRLETLSSRIVVPFLMENRAALGYEEKYLKIICHRIDSIK